MKTPSQTAAFLIVVLLFTGVVPRELFAADPAASSTGAATNSETLEPLVLKVMIGPVIASHAVPAVQTTDGRLLLPLGDICDMVRFPIAVDGVAGAAEGWFVDEKRTFTLDLRERVAVVAGEPRPFPETAVFLEGTDVFVDSDLLAEWFPLRFELEYSTMTMVIDSTEPLAFEQALERKQLRENQQSFQPLTGAAYDVYQEPYALWSPPVHDLELQGTYPTFEQAPVAQRAVMQRNAYQVRGAGDVLFMNGFWDVAGSENDALERARLRLERADPRGGLLGPLDASYVAVGDVNGPTVPLLTRGTGGAGVVVSNFPLHRPTTFSKRSLRGMLDPGWEVELYHNDRFVGFVDAGSDDEFSFDAPVTFGLNEYRLDFWGPYGEHHAEYDRAYVGPEMVRKGDFHYRAYTGLQERGLLPVEDWQTTLPGFGEPRASVEAEYGLVDSLSIFADTATTSLRDGRHVYGGGGIAAYSKRFYGTLRTVADLDGGAAGELTLLSRLLGTDVSARHVQFLGTFASEEFPVRADPLASRSEGRLSRPIPLWGNHVLPASLTARHDIHQRGPSRSALLARLSGGILRLGWANNLTLRAAGQEFTDLGGRATLRWRDRILSPRLELGYRVAPEAKPTSYGGGVSARISKRFGAEARVLREVNAAESWVASAGLRHRFDYFEWQLDGGYASVSGFSAGVSLRTSFGPDPKGGVMFSSEKRTTRGEVVATVFRDADLDGVRDRDEEVLEGADLHVDGFPRSGLKTDAAGRSALHAEPGKFSNLSISPGSLRDPFDVPATDGITVIPRPGRRTVIEFPVVSTGQVEGVVADAAGQEVSGLELELVDLDENVVARTRTAFDGFYVFDFVRPGEYRVRVTPEVADELGMKAEMRTVVVPGDGSVISGTDLHVSRESDPIAQN